MWTGKTVMAKSVFFGTLTALAVGVGLVACGGGGGGSASGVVPVVVAPPATPASPTCTNTSGAITLSAVAVRSTGVAPLSVVFDATATTHTTPTVRPFHDIEYRWNFGDPGSGNWGQGSRPGVSSRNSATGPIAGHVFESAGTYTIIISAVDGTSTATCQVQVVVQDPEVVYAGANTICVAAASTPVAGAGGCPAGAVVLQESNFATIVNGNLATNKRVLLKRGDTFTGATTANITQTGPWTLGAYGTGANPKIQNSGVAIMNVISVGAGVGVSASDGRIMDLEINGVGSASPANLVSIGGAGNFDQLTLLRLNINNIGDGPIFYPGFIDVVGNTRIWDQLAIIDSTIQTIIGGGARHGLYVHGTRFSIQGNLIDDTIAAEHLFRTDYMSTSVISNNTMTRGPDAAGPAGSKETIAIRGVGQTPATYYFPNVLPAPSPTEKLIISDNKFSVRGFVNLKVGPVSDAAVTIVRDIITERNWYVAPAVVVADSMIITQGLRHTIRNEIIDMSNMRFFQPVNIAAASTGMTAASEIGIFNNTFYSSTNGTGGTVDVILIPSAGPSNIVVRNNLAYFPALSAGFNQMVRNTGGAAGVVESNNSTDTDSTNQIKLVQPWASAAPTNPVDFRPNAASYAIGAGTPVPVWSDFFGVARPPHDLGAILP